MSDLLARSVDRLYAYRLTVLLLLHVVLIVIANQGAFWLRFDGEVPAAQRPLDTSLLPLLLIVRLAVFFPLQLHQGVWRYASIWDLRNIVVGVVISSVIFWAIVHGVMGLGAYPRTVLIMDAILLICLMGGVRLGRRLHAASFRSGDSRRVLIYGAGDAGEMIARDMLVHPRSGTVPVGFIDDNPGKTGLKIHDLPVFGTGERLQAAIDRLSPDEILVAIPSADPRTLRRIVKTATASSLPIKTLPRLREIPAGGVTLNEVRPMSVSDLLAREPIGLDNSRIASMIAGRCVLITGAAGSIGSELCRQILQARPARLVLFERYENGLFNIHAELLALNDNVVIVPALGDITDAERLEQTFQKERPSIVFHAAAHKHVPLMETNPSEAVKNNVRGTRLVAETALRCGADHVVLISTDKAVNPSSVMGATKLLAERIVQQYSGAGRTSFTCVRFGNVLGSNGSVVPTFLEQIKKGGPVTITHPEMRRYFMLIPEAVQLVLHAAALGGHGNVYVLNMGEQIRVADMARDIIRLSGYMPDEDIEIVFTGVRPGEKLSEELVGPDEDVQDSEVPDIKRVRVKSPVDASAFALAVERLERLASEGNDPQVMEALREMVPALNSNRPSAVIS